MAAMKMDPEEHREFWGFDEGDDPPELHPDLAACLYDSDHFGLVLKHPLVFDVPYASILNGRHNATYAAKLKALAEARAEKRWHTFVFLHERAFRFDAFTQIMDDLDDIAYWKLVGDVWSDTENLHQHYDEWEEVLNSERPRRERMMDEDERAALAKLPKRLTIYRGQNHYDPEAFSLVHGFSWTLDRAKALWFALRFYDHRGGTAEVLTATVAKSKVIAHLTGRNEQEIVVLPQHVKITNMEDVSE